MAELAIRTVFSLAVVLGLLLVLTRVAGRRYRGRSGAVRVVQRQALSRGSAVTVVEIGRRTLVLGVTEQQVQVLAELEPGELDGVGADAERDTAHEPKGAPARSRYLAALRPAPALRTTAAPEAGFADHLLVEMDRTGAADEPAGSARPVGRHSARHKDAADRGPGPVPADGALAGSLLSPQTWRQGWQVIGRRAS